MNEKYEDRDEICDISCMSPNIKESQNLKHKILFIVVQ